MSGHRWSSISCLSLLVMLSGCQTDGSSRFAWNPFAKKVARVDQDDVNPRDSGDEVYNNHRNATLEIDFSQFHLLIPAPHDSMSCPYIPSSSAG